MKIKAIAFIAALLACISIVFSEMSIIEDNEGNYSSTIFIYNEASPIMIWEKLDNNQFKIYLNENGDLNNDQFPTFDINPNSGYPEIVWSKFDGNDYEISFSLFNGTQWLDFEILTDNNLNEYDPKITFGNASRKVVWWSAENIPQVYFKKKNIDGTWYSKIRVSNESEDSRYPSVLTIKEMNYVAYETSNFPYDKNIKVAHSTDSPDPFPAFSSTVIGISNLALNSEATVHYENDHMWVDWIYDENFLCWSEKIDDEWIPQRYEPYSGPEDILRARLYIKIKALDGQ